MAAREARGGGGTGGPGTILLTGGDAGILPLPAGGQIGSVPGLGPATVTTEVRNLLARAGAAGRARLVAIAFTGGAPTGAGHGRPSRWAGARRLAPGWPAEGNGVAGEGGGRAG